MTVLLYVAVAIVVALVVFPALRRTLVVIAVFVRRLCPLLLPWRSYTRARALRLAFEDLGPAYIKFGQMIASSPTAFSKATTEEFARCLDEVRPISERTVIRIVERELEHSSGEVFAHIEPVPLASASIAQVHAARLPDGSQIVIKVQRPGIQGQIDQDIRLMRRLSKLAMAVSRDLRRANLTGVVDDFERTIHEEMDFRLEADNIDAFRDLLRRESMTRIADAPAVHRELTTARLLTLERFYGVRIDDRDGVAERVDDVVQMLRDTSEVFWTCVFLGGFFHGDIHAGNIMVLDDGRLGYLDFGIFGRFSDDECVALADWVGAMVSGNGEQMARALSAMGAIPEDADWDELVADVTKSFLPLRTFTVDKMDMLEQFFPTLREFADKHNARLPDNFVLILKQLAYFGRYVMLHSPGYNENLDPKMQMTFVGLFAKFNARRVSQGAEVVAIRPSA